MELEVGMYVRLHGKIGKIIDICKCEQCKLRGYYEPIIEYIHGEKDYISVYWKDNLKASNNIIDLIEVGDYVNGFPVIHKENDILKCGLLVQFKENEIKSIVTKEMYESVEYKVNE